MRNEHDDYYDYKVLRMPTSIFNKSDIKIILDYMKRDGWTLYDESKECYFFRKEKHC